MRRVVAQIEALPPASFVLLTGFVAGIIQGLPRLFLGGATTAPPRLFSFLLIGLTAVLWWSGAFLLWWIVVRRVRTSVWIGAAQITLALAIGETLAAAFSVIATPPELLARVPIGLGEQLVSVIYSGLFYTLFRSPLWFAGAALAISLGRHLTSAQPLATAPESTSTPP